jgi:hypothetical protein
MIGISQGKTEISLDAWTGFPGAPQSVALVPRFAGERFANGPTRQRDQTSICGNSFEPSAKVEWE